MSLRYIKPDRTLHRELRAVARRGHDLERALKETNLLPGEFPAIEITDLICILEALPDGTAEGCKEPLRCAGERLAEIVRDHIQIDDDEDDLPELQNDPDLAPPLARGGGVDQAISRLIGAIATARSEYGRQAGEIVAEDEAPERLVLPDADQARVLRDLDQQSGEISAEVRDFRKELANRDHFRPSEAVDALQRQGRDAETYAELVRQTTLQPVIKASVLTRLGKAISKLPNVLEVTGQGLKVGIDVIEPFADQWFNQIPTDVFKLVIRHLRVFADNVVNAGLRLQRKGGGGSPKTLIPPLSWPGYRKFYLHKREDETEGITSFYFRPFDGQMLPRYLPGQSLTFRLQIPGLPKPVVRCYSLSDAPMHQGEFRVSVKRLGAPPDSEGIPEGLASCFFHDTLEVDSIVDIKAPTGNFYLDMTDERPAVLIAGGIGVMPMLSMLNTIAYTKSKREIWLFYAVMDRRQHVMPRHLKRLPREHQNINVVICYAEPTSSCVKGRDFHYRGRINRRLLQGLLPSNNCQFYMCGPPPMQDALIKDLSDWGVAARDIKWESFGRRKGKKPAAPAGGDNVQRFEPNEIEFARSGKLGKWSSEEETVLDVAEAAGVEIDVGCRTGRCGTCEIAIKQGAVHYIEEPGTHLTPGTCLACIAIPKKGLVLDV